MSKNKSFAFAKAGLPFIVLTVGGWVGLSKTIQGRIDAQVGCGCMMPRSITVLVFVL